MKNSNSAIYNQMANENETAEFIPMTLRYNHLEDIELNFIEKEIRNQNILNCINLKLNKYKI